MQHTSKGARPKNNLKSGCCSVLAAGAAVTASLSLAGMPERRDALGLVQSRRPPQATVELHQF
jgi:hypothetical protein